MAVFTKNWSISFYHIQTDLHDYFISVMLDNISYYNELLSNIKSNKLMYSEYQIQFNNLKSMANKEQSKKNYMPLFIYRLLEKNIARNRKLKPRMDTEFILRATYVSPAGKKSYQKTNIYNVSQANKLIEEVFLKIKKRQTHQYQRTLMSPKIRYEVLQRDGFKCQICGSTINDGVQLHVDHILPISKGGKTEKSNLRTLCDRCNLGKSNKIE